MPASYDAWRTREPDRLEPADEEDDDMAQVALLETFAVTVPGVGTCKGELWSVSYRASGRRITVTAPGGMKVFDSDECYDLGNARNHLDLWLDEQAKPRPAAELTHHTGGGPVG